MAPPPREADLWRLWARASPGWGFLPASDGHRYRVLYPGRLNRAAGPDFRDALLLRGDGRLLRGDVEVHLSPQGWDDHGHTADPRYRGVLLHLVAAEAPPSPSTPPQVALAALLRPTAEGETPPFVGALPSLTLLHRWADALFRRRARGWMPVLAREGLDQALYLGVMEGLGYAANRLPMRRLAEALPYRRVRHIALPYGPGERPLALSALLLGAGGLLAPEDPLTPLWRAAGVEPPLERGAWSRVGVRPANRPERRLRGMALLLDRFWESGLAGGLLPRVREGPGAVEAALVTPSPWGGPALVGSARAREIAVSVVLPVAWGWAVAQGDGALRRAAWGCWKAFPPPPDNALTRSLKALLPAPLPPSARLQQGLLAWARRLGGIPLGEARR
jgi:hypothetical protein